MIYLIDIIGALLYMIFRIVILPVLLVVGCFFAVLLLIKTINTISRFIRSMHVKPALPLFRFAKVRLHLSK